MEIVRQPCLLFVKFNIDTFDLIIYPSKPIYIKFMPT